MQRRYSLDEAKELALKYMRKGYHNITCAGLLGIDFSKPGGYQVFRESGVWKEKCNRYVEFIIERLYELEDGKGTEKAG